MSGSRRVDFDFVGTDHLAQRLEDAAKYFRGLMRAQRGTGQSRNAKKRRAERPAVCDVCGLPPVGSRCINLDHDHVTGAFRGWLCSGCNHALGQVKDNPETLRLLADYLEQRAIIEPDL